MATTELARYRAKFRGMKVIVLGEPHVLKCQIEIELRQYSQWSGLFQMFYVSTGRPVSGRTYTLSGAKELVRILFSEQISEWTPVSPAVPNPRKESATESPAS